MNLNGELTLGENIADLGGVSISYHALNNYLNDYPQQNQVIEGFTPQQYGAMEYNMRNAINNSSGWEAWGGYTWRDWTQRLGTTA